MKRYAVAVVVALLVVCPGRSAVHADGAAYNVVTLGTIDGLVPTVTGINASGQISGYVTDANSVTHAVRYTSTNNVGWEYVPGLGSGSSTAAAINVNGDVTGLYTTPAGVQHAYRYHAVDGTIDDIAPLSDDSSSQGTAINDHGDVVGYDVTLSNAIHGWRAANSPGAGAVLVPTLSGDFALPCGINNVGQIAMTSFTIEGFEHAARIDTNSVVVDAGALDGSMGTSAACAIDDDGHIGGFSSAPDGFFHAFRFDPDGTRVMADAGLLSFFGKVESLANGASAGWFLSEVDGLSHALLHTDANGAVDLNTQIDSGSGWFLSEIKGINTAGWMVGDGTLLNGTAPGVFLLKPNLPDHTAPVIQSMTVDPSTILPQNRQPRSVTVAYQAIDNSGAAPTCGITSIVDQGGNSGDITGALTGSVLAIAGRTYAVTLHCVDGSNNGSDETRYVVVPPDTTPPIMSVTANPSSIPAQAGLPVTVTIAVNATDNSTVAPVCNLASITGPGTPGFDYSVTGQFTGSVLAFAGRTYTFNAVCVDYSGNAAHASVPVVVPDTTPPVVSVYASPAAIWPPNGKMVPVSVMITATDDDVDAAPQCGLTSITGGGAVDSAITGPSSADLRANNGTTYVLTVTCSDPTGNRASAFTTVAVTKTKGNATLPKASNR